MCQTLISEFCCGQRSIVWWMPPGQWEPGVDRPFLGMFAGSFNPLHTGHRDLLDVAAGRLGGSVVGELTVLNADKPPLNESQIISRCRQFTDHPVAVTRAATFIEKSRLFPGVTFVVGADTAERIIDPRFYGDDPQRRNEGLAIIARQQCRFLVAPRLSSGRLLQLEDLAIPPKHQSLFDALAANEFRRDISSTDLRMSP